MAYEYFLIEDGKQAGPFSIEDLESRAIGPKDKIWREGLPGWSVANLVPEVAIRFRKTDRWTAALQPKEATTPPQDVVGSTRCENCEWNAKNSWTLTWLVMVAGWACAVSIAAPIGATLFLILKIMKSNKCAGGSCPGPGK